MVQAGSTTEMPWCLVITQALYCSMQAHARPCETTAEFSGDETSRTSATDDVPVSESCDMDPQGPYNGCEDQGGEHGTGLNRDMS